jgi:putative SOS response-associated peptidase YedK
MCGRFVRYTPVSKAIKRFKARQAYPYEPEPSYNIAPNQEIIVVNNEAVRQLMPCRWGLIPSWSKDASIGNKMINARSETVAEKRSFRYAFKKHRCLVVADGFYEWKKEERRRQPVYIRLKSAEAFGFAGLYNTWISPSGDEVCTCTIITTAANDLIHPFHDRMPVIIFEHKEDLWLDQRVEDSEMLLSLLQPYPADLMEAYAVSPRVNTPGHDGPDNIKPT